MTVGLPESMGSLLLPIARNSLIQELLRPKLFRRRVVKNNIQSSKITQENSLNLKQARNSSALKQSQSVYFSYSSITGFKRAALYTTLALGLISNPYFAQAEENAVTSNLQAVAESYAQELGDVPVQDHWTRIEFSSTYIDPVVVVEGSTANGDNSYVVGIRNVDTMGFEVSLKNCNDSTDIPVQENVSYAVVEKSQLPTDAKVTQQFSWGECATTAATADSMTRRIL